LLLSNANHEQCGPGLQFARETPGKTPGKFARVHAPGIIPWLIATFLVVFYGENLYVAYTLAMKLVQATNMYILYANDIACEFPIVHLNPYKLIIFVTVSMSLGVKHKVIQRYIAA